MDQAGDRPFASRQRMPTGAESPLIQKTFDFPSRCRLAPVKNSPARILPNVQPGEEILTIQLIENLRRQEIDPIDKANGVVSFILARHSEMDLDKIINGLMNLRRDETRVENEITLTVSVISKITGISTATMQNLLSLLRLPQEIRDAVKTGALPVSQGYILAANLGSPGLMAVFEGILANPVTNKRLTELLKKADQADPPVPAEPPSPFRSVYTAAQKLTNCLENGEVRYDLGELENLRLFFLSVLEVIDRAKAGGGTAKEPDPPPEERVY
jgi:hypothetical protein